jgi:hypothetical protein
MPDLKFIHGLFFRKKGPRMTSENELIFSFLVYKLSKLIFQDSISGSCTKSNIKKYPFLSDGDKCVR